MKDQLIFDTTSADTILDSDSVGAYIRAESGSLITHTRVTQTVYVNLSVDAADVNPGGNSFTSINHGIETGQQMYVGEVGTLPAGLTTGGDYFLIRTGLDTFQLAATREDALAGIAIEITDAGIGANAYEEIPMQIKALDVNIAKGINVEVDLSHVDDSVRLGDGVDLTTTTTIGSDVGLDVNVIGDTSLANISIVTTATALATAGTAEKVVATNLTERKHLMIYNNDNRKMWIGGSSVDEDNGFPVSPGSYIELRAGAVIDVYFDSKKDGHEVRVLELN